MIPLYPDIISHSPQSGIVLEAQTDHFDSVDIQMEGDLGQMTNQGKVKNIESKYTHEAQAVL